MALSAEDYWDKLDASCFAVLKTAQEDYATKGLEFTGPEVLGCLMYLPLEEVLLYAISYLKLLAYRDYLQIVSRAKSRLDEQNLLGEGMGN